MDLVIAVSTSLLVTALLIAAFWLLSRRLLLVSRLRLALYIGSIAAGLKVFTLMETDFAAVELENAITWVLLLLGTVAVLQIVGLYVFDVYLHSIRGVRLPPLLPPVIMGALYLLAGLATYGMIYKVDVTPLLATSAITSLVLGLALQPILGNFFSGLVISLERPFRINDWIQVGETEGLVTDITWRTTHLRTRDNDNLVIPNSEIAGREITNFHYPHPLHLERIHVGVSYRTAPYRVREALLKAAEVDGVLDKPTPDVWLESFDESSIRYELRVWMEDHAERKRINARIREAIWERFKSRGITIPFPIRTLELAPQAEPMQILSRTATAAEVAARPATAHLFVSQGADHGLSIELDGSPIKVGRSHGCNLVLREAQASKEHLSISLRDGAFVLSDLGSQNGTRVNGCTVKETLLRDLDRITIGNTEIVFEYHG